MDKDTIVIGGEISLVIDEVDGEADLLTDVNGSPVTFYPIMPNDYTGAYEFTPTTETQIAATAGLLMTENIIINPIPQNYGLISWNGLGIRVS